MTTLLIPCDGSPSALSAARRAIEAYRQGQLTMVHLLNVQPSFSAHVSRHIGRLVREDFQRERARQATAQVRSLLDSSGVPNRSHMAIGDRLRCIVDAAHDLRCDRILVGTTRKSALVRAIGNSLTNQLIEHATVPVEVIADAPAAAIERIGIPAGVGVGMAFLWVAGS